jgi:hypothetical protein
MPDAGWSPPPPTPLEVVVAPDTCRPTMDDRSSASDSVPFALVNCVTEPVFHVEIVMVAVVAVSESTLDKPNTTTAESLSAVTASAH